MLSRVSAMRLSALPLLSELDVHMHLLHLTPHACVFHAVCVRVLSPSARRTREIKVILDLLAQ
jgi:hypothetical protein